MRKLIKTQHDLAEDYSANLKTTTYVQLMEQALEYMEQQLENSSMELAENVARKTAELFYNDLETSIDTLTKALLEEWNNTHPPRRTADIEQPWGSAAEEDDNESDVWKDSDSDWDAFDIMDVWDDKVSEEEMEESIGLRTGMKVTITPEYADSELSGKTFTLLNWDGSRGWFVDEQGHGWKLNRSQIQAAPVALDEGDWDDFWYGTDRENEVERATKDAYDAEKRPIKTRPMSGQEFSRKKLRGGDEEIDEVSKSTLKSYIRKAANDTALSALRAGQRVGSKAKEDEPYIKKVNKRLNGIDTATRKLEGADDIQDIDRIMEIAKFRF
jgi:hypothetical protein